jgi:alpha-L-fucosidase
MKKLIFLAATLMLLASCSHKKTEMRSQNSDTTKTGWWNNARIGLFIEWSPTSVWLNKTGLNREENDSTYGKLNYAEFKKNVLLFNTAGFKATEWAKIAKAAGARYVIFNAKDQDGFAMYKSSVGNYNVSEETLLKRDPLSELSDVCQKANLKLGVYYSLASDWKDFEPNISDPKLKSENFHKYFYGKALPQIKELLANYPYISMLYIDRLEQLTIDCMNELKTITGKYPNLIVSEKSPETLGGDVVCMDNIPEKLSGKSWELITKLLANNNPNSAKSADCLIEELAQVAAKGGNYLLPVVPTETGSIPDSVAVKLKGLGQWLAANGKSIYGTNAGPFEKLPWGYCTQRTIKNRTTLYLHVLDWPKDQMLIIMGLKTTIKDVYLLTNPAQKFAYRFKDGNLQIHAPKATFDPCNTVIVVETSGRLRIK